MADGNTIGGYPRLGHLCSADRTRAAQLWPDDEIQFRPVPLAEATQLARETEAEVSGSARRAEGLTPSHGPAGRFGRALPARVARARERVQARVVSGRRGYSASSRSTAPAHDTLPLHGHTSRTDSPDSSTSSGEPAHPTRAIADPITPAASESAPRSPDRSLRLPSGAP